MKRDELSRIAALEAAVKQLNEVVAALDVKINNVLAYVNMRIKDSNNSPEF